MNFIWEKLVVHFKWVIEKGGKGTEEEWEESELQLKLMMVVEQWEAWWRSKDIKAGGKSLMCWTRCRCLGVGSNDDLTRGYSGDWTPPSSSLLFSSPQVHTCYHFFTAFVWLRAPSVSANASHTATTPISYPIKPHPSSLCHILLSHQKLNSFISLLPPKFPSP